MQPYMPEETLKRMMLLENRIAELEATLATCRAGYTLCDQERFEAREKCIRAERKIAELEKLHKDCLSVIESQDERIAEQDLLLAQWESIDELNRERSQQRLQRIAQLEAELDKLYKEKSNRGAAIENM